MTDHGACPECGALVGHHCPCSLASPELKARWHSKPTDIISEPRVKDPWGHCYLDCDAYPDCPCGIRDGTDDLAREEIDHLNAHIDRLHRALAKIATGPRSDGTYNFSREACEQIAKEALGLNP